MQTMIIGTGHMGRFLAQHMVGDAELVTTDDALGLSTLGRPDMVVNTVGKTDLAWCEENPIWAFSSNAWVPLHLYSLVSHTGCIFVHLSSGCIWKGPYDEHGDPFGPDSLPSPACFYSLTKVAGEAMLHQYVQEAPIVILRPRQIYSNANSPRNLLNKLCGYPRLIDTPNSVTSAYTIAKTISKLKDMRADPFTRMHQPRIATLNVYDKGVVTPYQIGQKLHRAGCRKNPVPMSRADLDKVLWPERVDVVMEDKLFEAIVNPPEADRELDRVIGFWREKR